MIFAVWESVAWACGCASPPATLALPDQAHVSGPIRVFLRGRWPADGAQQAVTLLRVRAPDGSLVPLQAEALGPRLDLLPDRPLAPGRYLLEQLHTYADGERVPLLAPPDGRLIRQAWFPARELQIVDRADKPAPVPPVSWRREHDSSSCGPGSMIRAEVPPVAGARWLEVEVDGLGVVASAPALEKGFFVHVSDSVCSTHPVTLPPDEAVQVRAVAVGLDGARVPGAWTELRAVGPSHPSQGMPQRQRLAVPLQSEPTARAPDSCGELRRSAQEIVERDLPQRSRFDWADDGLRRLWTVEGGLWIDGQEVALPDVSGFPAMAASGPRTYAAYARKEGQLVLVAIEGARVLWSREVDGTGTPVSIGARGEALEVQWTDRVGQSRRTQRQRFDAAGQALGPAELDLEATRLELRGDGLYWLGEALPLPGTGHLQGRVDRREGLDYALYSSYEGGTWLAAVEAGRVLWSQELTAARSHPRSLRFDVQGLVAGWKEGQTERTAWLSYRGEPMAAFVPAREPQPPRAAVAYAGGEVRLRQQPMSHTELSFASGGGEGPPSVLATGTVEARLRVWEGALQVAVATGSELRLETWVCSGEPALGAPRRWTAP
jgi:hypothetical protein